MSQHMDVAHGSAPLKTPLSVCISAVLLIKGFKKQTKKNLMCKWMWQSQSPSTRWRVQYLSTSLRRLASICVGGGSVRLRHGRTWTRPLTLSKHSAENKAFTRHHWSLSASGFFLILVHSVYFIIGSNIYTKKRLHNPSPGKPLHDYRVLLVENPAHFHHWGSVFKNRYSIYFQFSFIIWHFSPIKWQH